MMKTHEQRFSVSGRVAMVTGASSGIGAHFAAMLAAHGAKVAVVGRRLDRLEQVAQSIRAAGGAAMAGVMDVSDRDSIKQSFSAIEAAFGAVDLLVNNAGQTSRTTFVDMQDEEWTSVIDVNLSAPYFVSKEMAVRLIAKGQPGAIVNIASILGKGAMQNFSSYGTSKGALIQLTKYLAMDLLPHHIRVNAIAPGYFPSEMTNPFFESELGKQAIASLPPKRLGRLEELDGALLLLASEAGSYINASTITVDYGHSERLS
jgi:NAD(P)-dependent dehydrogenase (short-subunit alcohol dehydrogenase family)